MFIFVIPAYFFLNSVIFINGEPRIVGGTAASVGQFPYQVSIQQGYAHFCGGSLVDLRHVVTAAHCMKDRKASEIMVRAGTTRFNDGGETQYVQEITMHENYDKYEKFDSDVAILALKRAFTKSKYIQPIILSNFSTPDNTKCIVSGWGTKYSGSEEPSEKLLYAEVKIVNHGICERRYHNKVAISGNMICAASPNKDSCQGDSGGPLAIDNELIGIVSFGIGCADPLYPGVYTNVQNFVKWIHQHSYASCNSIQGIQLVAMIIATMLYSLFFR